MTALQPSALLRAHIQQPIAIHARRCRTPRVGDSSGREVSWELREQLLAPIRQRSLSDGAQCRDGAVVEIAPWHRRGGGSLPPAGGRYISTILKQQPRRAPLPLPL